VEKTQSYPNLRHIPGWQAVTVNAEESTACTTRKDEYNIFRRSAGNLNLNSESF